MDLEAECLSRTQAWTTEPHRHASNMSEGPVHYFGSGKTSWQMGYAFGRAMESLLTP